MLKENFNVYPKVARHLAQHWPYGRVLLAEEVRVTVHTLAGHRVFLLKKEGIFQGVHRVGRGRGRPASHKSNSRGRDHLARRRWLCFPSCAVTSLATI
ncbi:hypothetical protein E2C01_064521 [Portunus trituberculatus]|uniref:Uncharacterized protein n=1 Tax=Portunus trituberculatus TaxID=210409 RepID=A0A5B7HNJ3_PORTR|nr:hypothetical protein [Portunus trituberculatus]